MLPQDEKVLWEVFCEHDKSLNGDLDRSEMEELDRFKFPIMNVKDPSKFERLVLGCIEADFCK